MNHLFHEQSSNLYRWIGRVHDAIEIRHLRDVGKGEEGLVVGDQDDVHVLQVDQGELLRYNGHMA